MKQKRKLNKAIVDNFIPGESRSVWELAVEEDLHYDLDSRRVVWGDELRASKKSGHKLAFVRGVDVKGEDWAEVSYVTPCEPGNKGDELMGKLSRIKECCEFAAKAASKNNTTGVNVAMYEIIEIAAIIRNETGI